MDIYLYINMSMDENNYILEDKPVQGQISDLVALLTIAGMTTREIQRVTKHSTQQCNAIAKKTRAEIQGADLNILRSMLSAKFQQVMAHHTLAIQTVLTEILKLDKRMDICNKPDKSAVVIDDYDIRDKLVDRKLKLLDQLAHHNQVLANVLKAMGVPTLEPDPEKESHTHPSGNNKIIDIPLVEVYNGDIGELMGELKASVERLSGYIDKESRSKDLDDRTKRKVKDEV